MLVILGAYLKGGLCKVGMSINKKAPVKNTGAYKNKV
jgi:hypothetical protein